MTKPTYLTAREAAAELGVSRATLYAYVSRGLVRSEALGDNPRQRRYRADDIQRLKQRKQLRRNPAKAAEQALSWGVPVLESGLTLISNGHLFYRGRDVEHLALSNSIEDVASLLWTGEIGMTLPERGKAESHNFPSINFRREGLAPINALQAALLQAESQDAAAFDLRPERVAQKGFSILHLLARIAAFRDERADAGIANIM